MVDLLPLTVSVLTSITDAIESTKSLYETVEHFRVHFRDRVLRRLQDELRGLCHLLTSLTRLTNAETSSVDLAIQTIVDLLEGIQIFPTKIEALNELVNEVKSLKTVLESLGNMVQTSADPNLLKLNRLSDECRMSCRWLGQAVAQLNDQTNATDSYERESYLRRRVGKYQEHIRHLRRILNGFKSTIEVVLSAPDV